MPQTGKVMPNLDERSTKMLNLTVLQRLDPFVEEILITAAHVTFYGFNVDSSQWSRKDVEGSLFVVKRNTQPRFQFIVMNRRNTDNLVENLLGDFEYEVQLPYLLYRNASQEVNGIWFYNPRECEEVANLFSRILNAYSKVPTNAEVSPSNSEFEELEAFPSPSIIDGPLEPSSSTNTNNIDIQDDHSFINFFSTAMNFGGAPNAAFSGQPYYSTAAVVPISCSQSVAVAPLPTAQTPTNSCTSNPIMSFIETSEPNAKHATDLVTPSFFSPPTSSPVVIPPITSSMPTAPSLNPPGSMQRPYGTPLLQPFPPPTPPPSLTSTSAPTPTYGPPIISREQVREALQSLVQDNQFIDMVYRAIMNSHQS